MAKRIKKTVVEDGRTIGEERDPDAPLVGEYKFKLKFGRWYEPVNQIMHNALVPELATVQSDSRLDQQAPNRFELIEE